jgi:putative ABC transport system permease protein
VRAKPGRRDFVMGQLEQSLAERVPGRFLERVQTMERTASLARSGLRASTIVLTTVAAIVALVTMLGVAGLAAFNVAARRKQLGTRRALGARKFHILRYFMVENWLITTLGCVAGCGLAIAIGLKVSQIYQLPRMPLYYLVAGVIGTWLLGLLAVVLPARRAASISPAIATRTV